MLNRPPEVPTLSHAHAAGAGAVDDYTRRAREWAGAVWSFWSPEHDRIKAMRDEQPATR